jgi:hypothetical protein
LNAKAKPAEILQQSQLILNAIQQRQLTPQAADQLVQQSFDALEQQSTHGDARARAELLNASMSCFGEKSSAEFQALCVAKTERQAEAADALARTLKDPKVNLPAHAYAQLTQPAAASEAVAVGAMLDMSEPLLLERIEFGDCAALAAVTQLYASPLRLDVIRRIRFSHVIAETPWFSDAERAAAASYLANQSTVVDGAMLRQQLVIAKDIVKRAFAIDSKYCQAHRELRNAPASGARP